MATEEYTERILSNVEGRSLLVTREYSVNLALLYKLLGEQRRGGEDVYTAVGPDPGETIRAYRRGERGIISGYGNLDHVPAGLGIYYLDQDPERLESEGFALDRKVYSEGDLATYLDSRPDGTWVLLSSKGEALSRLDPASREALCSMGLRLPSQSADGTCYVAAAVIGSGGLPGVEKVGDLSARLAFDAGDQIAGRVAPARVRLTSIIRGEGSRWRRCLSDLRQGRWRDAWHAFLAGPDRSSIQVHGREQSPDRNGLNIVLLEPQSGAIIGKGSVDVARTMGVNEVVIHEVLY